MPGRHARGEQAQLAEDRGPLRAREHGWIVQHGQLVEDVPVQRGDHTVEAAHDPLAGGDREERLPLLGGADPRDLLIGREGLARGLVGEASEPVRLPSLKLGWMPTGAAS